MSSLSRELVFLILQFLEEEKFKETVHKLEQESGFFFNMKYFEDQVVEGNWEEVERYLAGFTKVDDNRYSMKIFFEIRKQKYLEALDKQDRAKAVEILVKDLKVFSSFNEDLYKEITQLLTLDNFRENEQLSKYGDTKSARNIMLLELKKLIEANPLFRDKLQFPSLKASRLRTLINQSLNWQHQLCKNPRPNPDIKTLFVDHSCGPPTNGSRATPTPTSALISTVPKPQQPFPLGVGVGVGALPPFQPAAGASANALASWMNNQPAVQAHPVVPPTVATTPNAVLPQVKRPRTPPSNQPAVDYQPAEAEHLLKRPRPGIAEEATYPGQIVPASNGSGGGGGGAGTGSYTLDDLPKTVARTLNQGSCVMSMDFHPFQNTLLLVGTSTGDVAIWETSTREKLAERPFKAWDLQNCTMQLQSALMKDPIVSVNRVVWEPNGQLFGVAFSKHIVHIYTYQGPSTVTQHLEIDAHMNGVNDLAFSHPNKQLYVITCGDDKTIKVWDATNGRKLYVFEGHEAPVYSVCPHHKENIQFIFSTAIDGKIKAWLYDHMGSRVDYDAPGKYCTTMAYSADGTRLFSCGTSREGESFLVEWNESEGTIKRNYLGFRARSLGVVQFDTTRNKFLAAGDEFLIKFWDMDNTTVQKKIDADGGLPASPRLRFNRDGTLLAVTGQENNIKILANEQGLRLLRHYESNRTPETKHSVPPTPVNNPLVALATSAGVPAVITDRNPPSGIIPNPPQVQVPSQPQTQVQVQAQAQQIPNGMEPRSQDIKPRIASEDERNKPLKITEISEPQQCQSIRLPDNLSLSRIPRLMYTNSGSGLLALASNAVHKLWKWMKNERNPNGKATAANAPQLWQPSPGVMMTNEISDTLNPEEAIPCIALSKNDSYVMSASGGKVSLFNMLTFKVMTTFMPPPPTVTFLAFHPQDNNIVAIGMEDFSIQIYNVRLDEVKSKLKGHTKRITGLAFSNSLNILVSSGADAQICVWGTDAWDKRKSKSLFSPGNRAAPQTMDTRVQFHNDQMRILVTHETQLAVYDAAKLERIRQWTPKESGTHSAPISASTYSCDSQLVFAAFMDGAVCVFDAETLRPRCRIAPSSYLPRELVRSGGEGMVYPLVVAAHPQEANQFALGMSDGGVHVLEPLELEGKWGNSLPAENGLNSSAVPQVSNNGSTLADQSSR